MKLNGMTLTGGLTLIKPGSTPPPVIVTAGLTMNYDFSNAACYSGSGSAITDLSGTGTNGTFYTYSNAPPTAENATFSNSPSAPYFNGGITTQTTDNTSGKYFAASTRLGTSYTVSIAATIAGVPGAGIGAFWMNGRYGVGGTAAYVTGGPTLDWGKVDTGQTYSNAAVTGSVSIWDFVRSDSSFTLYRNGTQVVQGTLSGLSQAEIGVPLAFGAIYFAISPDNVGYGVNATYNSILVYKDSALTESQIQQNYNARKANYGLS
jgi:hypothetical protein